jgi:hypothetical protein
MILMISGCSKDESINSKSNALENIIGVWTLINPDSGTNVISCEFRSDGTYIEKFNTSNGVSSYVYPFELKELNTNQAIEIMDRSFDEIREIEKLLYESTKDEKYNVEHFNKEIKAFLEDITKNENKHLIIVLKKDKYDSGFKISFDSPSIMIAYHCEIDTNSKITTIKRKFLKETK